MEAFFVSSSDGGKYTDVLEYEEVENEPTDEEMSSARASFDDIEDDTSSTEDNRNSVVHNISTTPTSTDKSQGLSTPPLDKIDGQNSDSSLQQFD
ncbi:hypothetical protein GN244_ATG18233 [Phytophthora infestans]|uniref:Uncharacterized protein n=1 Tax=Phytophthora infestans TaxID=4787 RepID=A0A833W4X9_PHYIN|nr:hypothetical protein GN244_ATG18233 [Phytophthora infestans]